MAIMPNRTPSYIVVLFKFVLFHSLYLINFVAMFATFVHLYFPYIFCTSSLSSILPDSSCHFDLFMQVLSCFVLLFHRVTSHGPFVFLLHKVTWINRGKNTVKNVLL